MGYNVNYCLQCGIYTLYTGIPREIEVTPYNSILVVGISRKFIYTNLWIFRFCIASTMVLH